ncbi:MAG: YraN family protein [Gammaproteobacteria bacterium]
MLRARRKPPHLRRGAAVEKLALAHLRAAGLQLLRRNYRCAGGEVDIVMREREELVFVEVRYRNSAAFGGAAHSIDAGKQRRLRLAGETFLQCHPGHRGGCRFDVVAVGGAAPDYHLDWIRDAFS